MSVKYLGFSASIMLLASSAIADGDAASGEKVFNQCQSCHIVANEAGEVLAGRNGRQGPNLYGIVGRIAGSYPGFRYGDGLLAMADAGMAWDAEMLVSYLADPTSFVREATGNKRAKAKMSFRLRNAQDAADVIAFIASLSPAAGN
jgi:cytochrome c